MALGFAQMWTGWQRPQALLVTAEEISGIALWDSKDVKMCSGKATQSCHVS